MSCRSCGHRTFPVFSLGAQYLSDFRDDNQRPPKYPLDMALCGHCRLAQLGHTVPRELMYHERYGYQSGINDTIRADLRSVVSDALAIIPNPRSWLDIASNDGTLLSYVPPAARRTGIDPIAPLSHHARQHADRIVTAYFNPRLVPGPHDVITSISVFYDLEQPRQFALDIKQLLAPAGVWVVQQNYLGTMIQNGSFDNIVHEHLTYFSLISLENLLRGTGLEMFRVVVNDTNGGSFRCFVGHSGVHRRDDSVRRLRDLEDRQGLDTVVPLRRLSRHADSVAARLHELVATETARGGTIDVYGASTRGSTIWQHARIGPHVRQAVERNPAKVGRTWSPLSVPIVSEETMRADPPDLLLVGPWFFRDEFLHREHGYLEAGGRMVFPLPMVEVVDGRHLHAHARAA